MLQSTAGHDGVEHLTVGEAAKLLNVSPWTLRNWDKAGRLKPIRHPKNGYRIYRREQLEMILSRPDMTGKPGDRLLPNIDWGPVGQAQHSVQFYDTDAFLMDAVSGFIGVVLEAGEGGVVIATPSHRTGIENRLKARGIDPCVAAARGKYVAMDAAKTLSELMVDDAPNPQRFVETIGRVMAKMTRGGRCPRAFGEMVALLWARGNRSAAIRLEELWNDLAKDHPFSLLCGYPMRDFAQEDQSGAFGEVCTCHSHVVPAESYSSLASPDQRLRAITNLQQKAQALEAEIAHRKRVETEMRKAKEAAEQANKSKDQFLAMLSHELRTPLTPVLMAIAEMESAPETPPRLRDDLSMIRRNIALETRLIDDLLDLSRVINGKMTLQKERVDIHALIGNVVQMIQVDTEQKRLNVALELNAQTYQAHADQARMHQVLWNLLKNAVKFTPEGGNIVVRTRNQDPQRLLIDVEDSGIGIDSRALPHIFDPFDQGGQTVNRTFGGLGLGLAISKAVLDMHEGTISVRSEGKGRGSCFTVALFTSGVVHNATPRVEPAIRGGTGETKPLHILLVDDHLDTLRAMQRLLQASGHAITTATTVAEAVRQVNANAFDILISDISLPDGSGLDLMKQARLRRSELRGIATSGFGMEQDIVNSEQAGFSAHLTKPIGFMQLEAAIRLLVSPEAALIA